MTESFFDRLELELRAAAERPPRRLPALGGTARGAAIALVAAAGVALALVPALALLGGSDDDGALRPPAAAKPKPHGRGHTVVATGRAPVAGPWQLEVFRSSRLADPKTGEVHQPSGLPCLGLYLTDPRPDTSPGGAQCGRFRRTPGFSILEHAVPSTRGGTKEVLVAGRTPAAATAVAMTADGGIRTVVKTIRGPKGVHGRFYLIPVKPHMEHARVNWLDRDGNTGSRGIRLSPPASGHVKRG
jgi:hypothetical protein